MLDVQVSAAELAPVRRRIDRDSFHRPCTARPLARLGLCFLSICFACGPSAAEPADGSLEGDLTPEEASPAWSGPEEKGRPSLIGYVEAKDGCLVQKPGAPEWAFMRLDPSPLTALSYTVEIRFRITQFNMDKRYSHPLCFELRTKDICPTSVFVGQRGRRGKIQVNSGGKTDVLLDDEILQGKWLTVRVVVEGGVGSARSTVYLNGTNIQAVANAKPDALDWCYIRSDGDQDAWEIDYLRWKNVALDIGIPLEKPLTREEEIKRAIERLLE